MSNRVRLAKLLRSYMQFSRGGDYALLPSRTNPRVRRWQRVGRGDIDVDPAVRTAVHMMCQDCRKCGPEAPCGLGSVRFPPIPDDKRKEFARNIFHFFGEVRPGEVTDLRFYDLPFSAKDAHELARSYGYQVKFFGNQFGPPDFARYNYRTGYLMVYDPTQEHASFKDPEYTEKWRIIHELAHALTEEELMRRWGPGKRAGGIGRGLSMHDALRAIDWEDLAITTQHALYEKHFGFRPSKEDFAREMNTTLADSVYRVFTGEFSDPDLEGFAPSPIRVPTRRALDLTIALGKALGIEEDLGQNPYYPGKRRYAVLVPKEVAAVYMEVGFGAGLGFSWNGPHFMSRRRLNGEGQ